MKAVQSPTQQQYLTRLRTLNDAYNEAVDCNLCNREFEVTNFPWDEVSEAIEQTANCLYDPTGAILRELFGEQEPDFDKEAFDLYYAY